MRRMLSMCWDSFSKSSTCLTLPALPFAICSNSALFIPLPTPIATTLTFFLCSETIQKKQKKILKSSLKLVEVNSPTEILLHIIFLSSSLHNTTKHSVAKQSRLGINVTLCNAAQKPCAKFQTFKLFCLRHDSRCRTSVIHPSLVATC